MSPDDPTRTSRRRTLDLVRVGAVAVAGLALVLSAVVALGASPSPAGQPAASAGTEAKPGKVDRPSLKFLEGVRDLLKGGRGLGGFGGVAGVGSRGITITKIDGSTIELKTDDGWTRTITVTGDTTINRNGEAAKVGDLKVGDKIVLRQKRNDDGTYSIVAIVVPVPVVAGTVTKVDGDSLTLKTRGGTTKTVNLTGATTYKLGRADGTKADVKVGTVVVATGVEGSGDTFTAKTVRIEVRLSRIGGEVTAKTKDTITVKQRDGKPATIKVGSDTKFVLRGDTTPALADIAVGMRVQAFGTLGADGTLSASYVAAGKAKP